MAIIKTFSFTEDDEDTYKKFKSLPGGLSEKIIRCMRQELVRKGDHPTLWIGSPVQEWKDFFDRLDPKDVKRFQKKWVELDYLLRKRVEKLL